MNLDRFRLRTQLGAGSDGVSYRADSLNADLPVELRDLSRARAVSARWHYLLPRLRLVGTLFHPAVLEIVDQDLAAPQPYLAMRWIGTNTLSSTVRATGRTSPSQAITIARALAGALASAHRLGLAHGRLGPDHVWIDDLSRPYIDFTGVDTGFPAPANAPSTDITAFIADDHAPTSAVDRAGDLQALGRLLLWMVTGSSAANSDTIPANSTPIDPDWASIIHRLLAEDPADRPSALEVHDWLTAIPARRDQTCDYTDTSGPINLSHPDATVDTKVASVSLEFNLNPDEDQPRYNRGQQPSRTDSLGRYQILEKLGEGGQGIVYRALDPATGRVVAIKMLRAERASNPDVLRRFRKEARLMAEANNPYVVNLLEYNEDDGLPYLVLEFVAGQSVSELLDHTRLDEPEALRIMAGVARGLVEAHERGIVHRDIKPSNILLLDSSEPAGAGFYPDAIPQAQPKHPQDRTIAHGQADEPISSLEPPARIKVSDFGLARHVVDSESLALTAAGALLGTPNYMSPEQWTGTPVDPRTDVYAMGVTLYHMLAGRLPFTGNTTEELRILHCNQQPAALESLTPTISEGVARVVARAMAKNPGDRYLDASAMLRDLDALLHGKPTAIPMHPVLPDVDPRKRLHFEFRWDLESLPRQLWPFVTNTDRLDRAIGFPAMRYKTQFEPGVGVRTFAEGRKAGMIEVGEEHPYEWVEPRRMGVLREYSQGPFVWVVSTVELIPRPGGGTTLVHRLDLEPRNWKIRLGSRWGVGVALKKSLAKVYERIDATLIGRVRHNLSPDADEFEQPAPLTPPRRQRLERLLERLEARGIAPSILQRLGRFLSHAPAPEVARIRPLALAERLNIDPDAMVAACLHAVAEGLLVLHWDLLCPICRISCDVKETLRAIDDHAHCTACHLDFKLDFANSIELIFRVHPEVREADLGTYCIGGPAHSPHVLAQVRVAPSERLELELDLGEGSYRLRGPQLPWSIDFHVTSSTAVRRWELDLGAGPPSDFPSAFRAGGQILVVTNSLEREVVIRVERTASRSDALTAARAASLALFRELFPGERLAPGRLATVSTVTFLVTEIDAKQADSLYEQTGDAQAFAVIHKHFEHLGDAVRHAGGAVVKTQGESLIAAFSDVTAAVKTALELPRRLAHDATTRPLRLRVGVHRGTTLAATLNDQLDYFGTTSRQAAAILRDAKPGHLVLTEPVASDPEVAALLNNAHLETEIIPTDLSSHPHLLSLRLEANEKTLVPDPG